VSYFRHAPRDRHGRKAGQLTNIRRRPKADEWISILKIVFQYHYKSIRINMAETENMYSINAYKIWYADDPEECYVGSSKNTLSRRMADHRNAARRGRTSLIYRTMREKGINTFQYVLLGTCMVRNKDEQRMYEQQWIDQLNPSLNKNRAYITEEENKQKIKEYRDRPEYKQKMKEYQQRPEVKQKQKEYYQRPEIKQKMREYYQRPEYKQKKKEYWGRIFHCEYCDQNLKRSTIKNHCGTRKHKDNYKKTFKEVFEMEIADEEIPDYL
jgi:hypothetical protein